MKVYIRQPKWEEIEGKYVTSPFTVGLWWTIIITIMSLIIAFLIDWKIRLNYGLKKTEDLASSIFSIFTSFCQQGEYRSLDTWLYSKTLGHLHPIYIYHIPQR
jgi:hypothetical protein